MGTVKKASKKAQLQKAYLTLPNNTILSLDPFPFSLMVAIATIFFLGLSLLFLFLPSSRPSLQPKVLGIHTNAQPAIQVDPNNPYCLTVPIILYHHIQPLREAQTLGHAQLTVDSAMFEEHMKYLTEQGYHTLSVDTLVRALLSKTAVPEKSIVVTLDDGYGDWYTYAYPIIKKYNIAANLMISSGLVGKTGYLTWDQLKDMSKNPLISIYNHTHSHAALANISEEQMNQELTLSQSQLGEELGIKPTIFTYPYGSYNDVAVDQVKKHGFVAALTTQPGRVQCDSERMTLHRDHVGNAPLSTYEL